MLSLIETHDERARSAELPGRITLELTPWGAFAAGSLVVSALALAFALGRRLPAEAPPPVPSASVITIDEVRQQPPLVFQKLEIDTGQAD